MTNKPLKSLTRKAQGEETRATLLATSERLFALHGYNGVSMRTLAAEAGVNLATVSYHFGGKAGLYEAIIQSMIEVRDDIFPTAKEVASRLDECGDSIEAKGEVVTWFAERLVYGILGNEEHIWASFLMSREMAQPSDLFPRLEKDFFNPTFESLCVLVKSVLHEDSDHEEIVITAHCLIGLIIKFLEGHSIITKRLDWDNYQGEHLDKLASVLTKRIRGLLGLSMENA